MKSYSAIVATLNRRQNNFRVKAVTFNEITKTLFVHAAPGALKKPWWIFTKKMTEKWAATRGQSLLRTTADVLSTSGQFKKVRTIRLAYAAQ